MTLETLRTTFIAWKSLPKVSPGLRFFSVSQVGYEPLKDTLNTKVKQSKEQNHRYQVNRNLKSQTDPEYRRGYRGALSVANRRRHYNPDHHEKILTQQKIAQAQYRAEDPDFYIKNRLRQWVHKHAWVRDEFDWKAHTPVWSAVKVSRTCASCQIERYNGAHPWWVRMRLYRSPKFGTCYDVAVPYHSSTQEIC